MACRGDREDASMTTEAKPRRRPLRVIQWSTGNAGRKALRGILNHPDLELVGVHAHSAEKIGRDAAQLCDWGEADRHHRHE